MYAYIYTYIYIYCTYYIYIICVCNIFLWLALTAPPKVAFQWEKHATVIPGWQTSAHEFTHYSNIFDQHISRLLMVSTCFNPIPKYLSLGDHYPRHSQAWRILTHIWNYQLHIFKYIISQPAMSEMWYIQLISYQSCHSVISRCWSYQANVPNYRNDVSIAPRHPDFALLGALLGRRSSPNNLQQNADMDRITWSPFTCRRRRTYLTKKPWDKVHKIQPTSSGWNRTSGGKKNGLWIARVPPSPMTWKLRPSVSTFFNASRTGLKNHPLLNPIAYCTHLNIDIHQPRLLAWLKRVLRSFDSMTNLGPSP